MGFDLFTTSILYDFLWEQVLNLSVTAESILNRGEYEKKLNKMRLLINRMFQRKSFSY